jgi:hypothetical protein
MLSGIVSVSARDRDVFRRIAEAESSPQPVPQSFQESLDILERLIVRRRSLFGEQASVPSESEFQAHEALYTRAHALGVHGS